MNIIYKAIRVLKHTLYFVFYTKHKILSYDNIYFVFLYIYNEWRSRLSDMIFIIIHNMYDCINIY